MKNKLAKQAYFIKRMRDSGYQIEKIYDLFSKTDPRAWTIMINPGTASVFCTCYSNHGESDEIDLDSSCFFELFDGGQFIPGKYFKLETNSIETFITYLVKFGINNKAQPINRQSTEEESVNVN